ncbi:dihydropteroate synthase [Nocardioides mangrovicus]|uniref:Dihydropteroate synthase n=1 Tax=Nocardioides mangrovicus TaxID=2478913 RepID=A0A3L8P4W9_9ACTN|nr:dihydropteroate synthase [Nocardioides mangrovicus]RLV50410.1 dihydropteroate synthase [Nocardioides mangrovicus]
MISLRELARLVAEHGDALDRPVAPFLGLAGPALMGVVNLSRDSWYRESVATTTEAATRRGRVLAAQGAHVVDVGAESVVDGAERVEAEEQSRRLVPVIEELSADGIAVSVESYHPRTVEKALAAGARVLNLTGSDRDEEMFDLAAAHGAAVVLCHIVGDHARALSDRPVADDPVPEMLEQFEARLAVARARGVEDLVVDPGIGFGFGWLADPVERARYQARSLLHTFRLRTLGVPVCHALPSAMDVFGEEVRSSEGYFAVLAALGQTDVYRTHEVPRVRAVLEAMATFSVDP